MTKKIGDFHLCEECMLLYREQSWAEKCEEWCRKRKSCNIEITKHAVPQNGLALSK